MHLRTEAAKKNVSVALVAFVAGIVAAAQWNHAHPENACEPLLQSNTNVLHFDEGIEWPESDVHAKIFSVRVECLPVRPGPSPEYQIFATAYVTPNVNGPGGAALEMGGRPLDARLIFELMSSETHVVLAAQKATLRIVEGLSILDTSVKFEGLSNDVVRRVGRVRARWAFGS